MPEIRLFRWSTCVAKVWEKGAPTAFPDGCLTKAQICSSSPWGSNKHVEGGPNSLPFLFGHCSRCRSAVYTAASLIDSKQCQIMSKAVAGMQLRQSKCSQVIELQSIYKQI